jgi:hypothetical protein
LSRSLLRLRRQGRAPISARRSSRRYIHIFEGNMKRFILVAIILLFIGGTIAALPNLTFINSVNSFSEPNVDSDIKSTFAAGEIVVSSYVFEKQDNQLWIKLMPEWEYVLASEVIYNSIKIGEKIIGINSWIDPDEEPIDYAPEYFQVYSEVAIYNQNSKTTSRINDYADVSDTQSIFVEDDKYIVLKHEYNRFTTGPVGYEGYFYFDIADTQLATPIFHYFNDIGSQDFPYLSLENKVEENDTIILIYEYYEAIGLPQAGNGALTFIYEKIEGSFVIQEVQSTVEINPAFYGEWPFRKWQISPGVYVGDGWYPAGSTYSIGIISLQRKFKYFTSAPGIIFGIESILPEQGQVVFDHVRVRSFPNLEGQILGKLFTNDIVDILDRSPTKMQIGEYNDYWYLIESSTGLSGWAYSAFIE